jgi:predicted RND superfamily exporter protein
MWDMLQRMLGDTLWIYTAIAGSLLGAAFLAWFRNTHAALYLMSKFDGFLDYLVDRFGWDWLQDDPEAWRKRYPKVTKKIDELELRIKTLEAGSKAKVIKQKETKK